MVSISLCMIVRNEEKVLGRCLACVQGFADEIIIVDTGSTDRTKEIAFSFTDKVYDFKWKDDFAAARNFAFSKGTGDYLFWLDADDVLLSSDRQKLLALKAELDGTADVVMLPYHTGFDEQGRPTFFCYRERLLKTSAHFRWQGAVHECIPVRRRGGDTPQAAVRVLRPQPENLRKSARQGGKAGCTRQLLLRARAAGA